MQLKRENLLSSAKINEEIKELEQTAWQCDLEVHPVRMYLKTIVVLTAFLLTVVSANPAAKKSNYIEQENSCRQVCGLCDCDGFYCEDECICECTLENDESKWASL